MTLHCASVYDSQNSAQYRIFFKNWFQSRTFSWNLVEVKNRSTSGKCYGYFITIYTYSTALGKIDLSFCTLLMKKVPSSVKIQEGFYSCLGSKSFKNGTTKGKP